MKYRVSVEKQMLVTGTVEVFSDSAESAEEQVAELIESGKLQTTDVDWDDPTYVDHSFTTTGDVD